MKLLLHLQIVYVLIMTTFKLLPFRYFTDNYTTVTDR